jgi:hypothetical protein
MTFTHHTVAWEGSCSETEDLFDACLEIDGDEDPTTAPHQALLAANMRFGAPDEKQYVFRLSPPPTPSNFRPTPDLERSRRPIHPNPTGAGTKIKGRLLSFLENYYKYQEWRAQDSIRETTFLTDPSALLGEFASFNVVHSAQIVYTSNRPPVIIMLMQNQTEALVRVDVDVCSSQSTARDFLLQRIGRFQTPTLIRQIDCGIGDVTFIEPESGAVLFARGNLVLQVRDAGSGCISLADAALALDNVIKRSPQDESAQTFR